MSSIDIIAVKTPAELDRFIRVPMDLYKADPAYVAPLILERKEALSPKKNPYFQHAETQFWIARLNGRDVGRISAQIDSLIEDKSIGQFGMLAAIDDKAVISALFAAAEAWLRERGKTRIQGPFNLSINEETGLLVKGFETPPVMLMPHDAPYLGAHVEAQGYAKVKDLIAYWYDMHRELPKAARYLIDKRKPATMTVRNLDVSRYDEEFDMITAIYNDAWSENWGFIPFTEAEISHMAKSMKPLINPKWVAIVELNGEAVGFGITLPNLNEAIRDFKGALLPLNWIKLLLRLKRGVRSGRVPLMGVRRSLNNSLLAGLAPFLIIDAMRKGGQDTPLRYVELSWILEDNHAMRHIIESLGADPYKTYRVYEKALT